MCVCVCVCVCVFVIHFCLFYLLSWWLPSRHGWMDFDQDKGSLPITCRAGTYAYQRVGLPEVQLVCQHADAARWMCFEVELFFKVCLASSWSSARSYIITYITNLHRERKQQARVSERCFSLGQSCLPIYSG